MININNKKTFVAFVILSTIMLLGIIIPEINNFDPTFIYPQGKFQSPGTVGLLGTDNLGRDIFIRLCAGARYSLTMATTIVFAIFIFSLLLGSIPTYFGGKIDRLFVTLCDLVMAFPQLVLVMVLMGILGKGSGNLMFSMIFAQTPWYAKIVRGYMLEEKNRKYVESAIISGSSSYNIILCHIIPNILPGFIVYTLTGMGRIILELSAFSFLGLGVDPSIPEWGMMLSQGRKYIFSHPELMLYPGFMIFITSLGFNLLGDGLRDTFDKRGAVVYGTNET
ncbi:MAG: ABC transporter permease [Firmicutes bacterium]|jgi:peptide/nickel transport system permease protein/nickel transport system permease protein|nr:ABC transporter permease [Bacillota bacterium]